FFFTNSCFELEITVYKVLIWIFFLQKCIDSLQEAFIHPPESCEALFMIYRTHIFQESTWEEALLYCRQNYKYLAILNSDELMTEARDKSRAALTDDVWIGLRFIAGHWFWANGEAFEYKVWSSVGELQCPAINQRCAVLNRNSMVWEPVDCEQRFNFLCANKT
uniref:C-type lectin domain-containing protein n=1 Tax=Sinocyclocheilus grahami TaxID=75366 RepID=A0A672QYT6_SINGR